MKKFIASVVIALSFFSSASFANSAQFGDWKVPYDAEYTYSFNEQGGSVTEFKLGKGWFSVLEYPRDTTADKFVDAGATKTKMVWNVNGTNVKFIVHRDINNWLKVVPETTKGNNFIMEQFWKSQKVVFTSQYNGSTFVASAKGVQAAYRHLNSRQAI